MYEQLAMAYQSDVAKQVLSKLFTCILRTIYSTIDSSMGEIGP